MFNAGVPVKTAVAGIAMGLVMEGDEYRVLSDILGLEDHLGDMDFKVAGTSEGITAFQLDIKIEGITPAIMRNALEQAKEGRLHILNEMNNTIAQPEKALSPFVPKILMIMIDPDKIGAVIGGGGKVIRSIIEATGTDINIEDDGSVTISSTDDEAIRKAENIIRGLVAEPEIGKIYKGIVKKITDFGAFVEILPGKEGLVHISKLDHKRVNRVQDVVDVGDEIDVKLIKIDKSGKIDLSRKDAMQHR